MSARTVKKNEFVKLPIDLQSQWSITRVSDGNIWIGLEGTATMTPDQVKRLALCLMKVAGYTVWEES